MIRILQVFGWTDRGGAETMVMNYYRNIDRSKIQFDFVKHTTRRCAYDDEIERLGGRIFSVPQFKGYNIISYHRAWVRFLKQHPEWHTIHIHQFTLGSQIALAAKCSGIKNRIIHVHSVGWKGPLFSLLGIHSRFNVAGFSHTANYLFACGQKSGEFFYGSKPFTIMSNAVEVDKFKPDNETRNRFRDKCGFNQESFVIAHVGRFIDIKNHTFLVRVLAELLKQKPEARLLLVGDGETRQSTEDLANQLDIRDKIYFAGVQGDVYNWLQAADCFVLPSTVEGLPVCIVEAEAAGLPCIMSDHLDHSVDVTGCVSYESVGSSPQKWAKAILKIDSKDKAKIHNQVYNSQYNIANATRKIGNFYLSIQ